LTRDDPKSGGAEERRLAKWTAERDGQVSTRNVEGVPLRAYVGTEAERTSALEATTADLTTARGRDMLQPLQSRIESHAYCLYLDFPGPMVDPWRAPSPSYPVAAKGGLANGWPGLLRTAERFPLDSTGLGCGLRLVRTLKDGETWPSADK
jgi:hypothetical protein